MYVKRVFTVNNKSEYIDIPKEQYESVRKSQEEHERNNKPFIMKVSKAPAWYPPYRYIKSNYDKAIWFILGAVAVEAIHLLFSKIK
jgi:hypothetical protein